MPDKNLAVHVVTHSLPDIHGDGGQQRIEALFRALALTQASVSRSFFLWPDDAEAISSSLPATTEEILASPYSEAEYVWWLHEYFLGLRVADDARSVARLARKLRRCDVVVVDHLWGWPLVRRAVVESGWQGKIVYHAHNAEHQARAEAITTTPDQVVTQATLDAIGRLEASLCLRADLVVACTEQDRLALEALGARQTAVVPNGANRLAASSPGVQRGGFLYVASAWHPNASGFEQTVLRALALMQTAADITIVGGACDLLVEPLAESRKHWRVNHRINLRGRISRSELAEAYQAHSAVLIPVVEGSGSCIKTAEALVNGMPAIATPHGIRGYEEHVNGLGQSWQIGSTSRDWSRLLTHASTGGLPVYPPESALEWDRIAELLGEVLMSSVA